MQTRRWRLWIGWVGVCLVVWMGGCGGPGSGPDRSKQPASHPATRRQAPIPPDLAGPPTSPEGEKPAPAQTAGPSSSSSEGASSSSGAGASGVKREKAVVGVSPKGQGYGGGLITEPISLYFKVPQMMVFRIQIPHAMNLYRGLHGHFPKTHEEFMDKIIKENAIQLPPLPAGARYVYDPQKAAQMQEYDPADPPLFVERPAP